MTQEEFHSEFISQSDLTSLIGKSTNYFDWHIPTSFPEPLRLKVGSKSYKLYRISDIRHNLLTMGVL
jgi:hypothetical protein